MTKSLMISIQPQHAVNILNGKKTLELRTWIPKDYDEDGRFILDTLKNGVTVTIPELKKKYLLSEAPKKYIWVYAND